MALVVNLAALLLGLGGFSAGKIGRDHRRLGPVHEARRDAMMLSESEERPLDAVGKTDALRSLFIRLLTECPTRELAVAEPLTVFREGQSGANASPDEPPHLFAFELDLLRKAFRRLHRLLADRVVDERVR